MSKFRSICFIIAFSITISSFSSIKILERNKTRYDRVNYGFFSSLFPISYQHQVSTMPVPHEAFFLIDSTHSPFWSSAFFLVTIYRNIFSGFNPIQFVEFQPPVNISLSFWSSTVFSTLNMLNWQDAITQHQRVFNQQIQ